MELAVSSGGLSTLTLSEPHDKNIEIRRPALTQNYFEDDHLPGNNQSLRRRLHAYVHSRLTPSSLCMFGFFRRHVPIVEWMPRYRPKEYLVNDLVSGLTVGIMHISQGMAYGMLANLHPVYGLYVSFFPGLIYVLLGTSRHISVGTFAVVSLMVGAVVNEHVQHSSVHPTDSPLSPLGLNMTNSTGMEEEVEAAEKLSVATALALLTGLIQLVMGILHLGVVNSYLSDAVVTALNTGSAVHVLTSQLKHMVGVRFKDPAGNFKVAKTLIVLFGHMSETNVASLVTACACVFVCILVKDQINERFKKQLRVPIPIEIITVVVATIVFHYGRLHHIYDAAIVGPIPTGLPAPRVPDLWRMASLVDDALAISIVSFAINMSIGRVYAKKHGYTIEPSQELVAYGCGNVFSSFFLCFPSSGALGRSSLLEGSGGKTQVTTLASSVLVLVVLLALGGLFEDLPTAVLASIVVVNLRGMLAQMVEVKRLWRINRWEMSTWLATFLGVVLIDVPVGLVVGVVASFLSIVVQTQLADLAVLGRLGDTDIFRRKDVSALVRSPPARQHTSPPARSSTSSRVLREEARLGTALLAGKNGWPSREQGRMGDSGKADAVGWRPVAALGRDERVSSESARGPCCPRWASGSEPSRCGAGVSVLQVHELPATKIVRFESMLYFANSEHFRSQLEEAVRGGCRVQHLVIDCSAMSYMDSVGAEALHRAVMEQRGRGLSVSLCHCRAEVRRVLTSSGYMASIGVSSLHPSTSDAVHAWPGCLRASMESVLLG